MKKIYMVQPSDSFGSGKTETRYLPYASGLLIANAFENDVIKSEFQFSGFHYRKENPEKLIGKMQNPSVVGFSCYIWNMEYNLRVAAEVKKKYPDCVIIFGGHSVLNDSCEQLDKYDFVDFLIHGEGENAFLDILLSLCGRGAISEIPNISYRDRQGKAIKTRQEEIVGLDYPSPYLKGYFDELIEKDKIEWTALFETNRGCPFKCAYCDWGAIGQKIRQFPLERVVAEFLWFSEHKIVFCFCIDANFGMFKRDFEIVDRFIEIKNKTGYPSIFKCCITEGSGMTEFEITKKLNECNLLKSACLSMQTLSPEALKIIGRKNMTLEKFGELSAKYNESGIPTYSEFILGLPGETYDTFTSNLCGLIEFGTTNGLMIHYCELLSNSKLGRKENIEQYKIVSARIPYGQFHTPPTAENTEYSDIIIETFSMNYASWVEACIFGLFIEGLFFMGALRYISVFLHNYCGASYRDFFEKLIEFAKENENTVIGRYYKELRKKLGGYYTTGTITRYYYNPLFSEITFSLDEGLCLEVLHNHELFYSETEELLRSFAGNSKEFEEVLKFQKMIMRYPEDVEKEERFSYDFIQYFKECSSGHPDSRLERKNLILKIHNKYAGVSNEKFATEILWYGKNNIRMVYSEDETESIREPSPD